MKNLYWLFFTKHNRILTYVTIAVFGLVLVLSSYFGIKVVLLEPSSANIDKTLKSQKQDLAMAERSNNDLKAIKPPSKKQIAGRDVVDRLQQEIEARAVENACRIDEFSAPPTPGDYVPHYGSNSGGYKSYHIRMMVSGNLSRIVTLLQGLSDSEVPFEFTSLGFTPTPSQNDPTSNTASATVEMDVLSRGGTS